MNIKVIKWIFGLALFSKSYYVMALDTGNTQYLIKPSGQYRVAYKDQYIVNNGLCPDKIYQKGINESSFSNNKYCHEVLIRTYYPTQDKFKHDDNYYSPYLHEANKYYVKTYKLSESESTLLNSILSVQTYMLKDVHPIPKKRFPVLLFLPGSGQSTFTYNNIISNLVSHGYVVVGINSVFASGPIKILNGNIVSWLESYNDNSRLENLDDLSFILNNIKPIFRNSQLKDVIDYNNIGLIGHSMGAMNIVYYLNNNVRKNIKMTILMDPGNIFNFYPNNKNYPIDIPNIPTMLIWSSNFKVNMHGSMKVYRTSFEVTLSPDLAIESNFTNHENFSDLSTLQYSPAYMIPKLHNAFLEPKNSTLGNGNGVEVAKTINSYMILFTDYYMKNIHSKALMDCYKITNSEVKCGK